MISKSSLYVTIDTKFYDNIVFFSHKLMLLFIIKSTESMSTFSMTNKITSNFKELSFFKN